MLVEQAAQADQLSELKMGLRQLVLSGEHFRHVLGRQLQLGPSDLTAVDYLYSDGPLTPSELASRLEMTSGTMTSLLDRVEKAGFLSRSRNPQDRRSLLISATPAGKHAVQWVYDHVDTVLREAVSDIPGEIIEQLAGVLAVLGQALEEHSQVDGPG